MTTQTKDVMTGADARLLFSKVAVEFPSADVKALIFDDSNKDSYLLITKEIGSRMKITDAVIIDDAFIDSVFAR